MRFMLGLLIIFSSQVFAEDLRVSELKSEIMALAKESGGKPDLEGKLQSALEEKVQDLEKIIPFETMEEKASKVVGSWHQIFGPYSAKGDGTIPFGSRTDKIYQIIFPGGLFYNVALFEKARLKAVFLLKGSYKVTDESIEGTFVRNSIMIRDIDEEKLFTLPSLLEAGSLSVIHLPKQLPPVGFGGKLLEVYADSELRILRGVTAQFSRPALYVMEKVKN
jgi:hypothetical protein